jgi:spermidine dehydrogenase
VPPPFTRRDFLNATLLASGGTLLGGATPLELLAVSDRDFDGFGGIGDYARAHGNSLAVLTEGHKIRDGVYARVPARDIVDAGAFDCVVVGGGISGLAAALFFSRQARGRSCLVVEDHSTFGGLARRNDFEVDGAHLVAAQASALFFPPLPDTFLASFYPSIGIETSTFEYQKWGSGKRELPVGTNPYFGGGPSSAYYFGPRFGQNPGRLVVDPMGSRLADAPIPEGARRELLAMEVHGGPSPRPKQHGDADSRRLDSITLEQHLMERFGLSRETVRTYVSPVAGGGSGIGADVLSAYADYAADVLIPWDYDKDVQMFPGGNTGVARHIVKTLIPDVIAGPNTPENVSRGDLRPEALDRAGQLARIRTGCTVVSVAHTGKPESADVVEVTYALKGKLHRVKARAAILAGGSHTTRHIVKDLPATHQAAYAQFHRSPCLVASVALRHWRFLYDRGIHECRWFEGIGNYGSVCRVASFGPVAPTLSPDAPVALTLKILFSYPGETLAAQGSRGRAELLSTPYRDYERRIREQLTAMFGSSGFDPKRDMAGLILNRWGHAYLSPQPGFFFGQAGQPAPGEVLRNNPVGRVAFGNSDVTGIMDHRASILEADRAVRQVLERGHVGSTSFVMGKTP